MACGLVTAAIAIHWPWTKARLYALCSLARATRFDARSCGEHGTAATSWNTRSTRHARNAGHGPQAAQAAPLSRTTNRCAMSYLPDPMARPNRPGGCRNCNETETENRKIAMPLQATDIGALRGVIYSRGCGSNRKTFVHFMEDPPRLQCSSDGRQLFICGGSYLVTKHGIEG